MKTSTKNLSLIVIFLFSTLSAAHAEDWWVWWTGANSTNWRTASNWDINGGVASSKIPDNSAWTVIGAGAVKPTLGAGDKLHAGWCQLKNDLTLTDGAELDAYFIKMAHGEWSDIASITINGGNNLTKVWVNKLMEGTQGTATININGGGEFHVNERLYLGAGGYSIININLNEGMLLFNDNKSVGITMGDKDATINIVLSSGTFQIKGNKVAELNTLLERVNNYKADGSIDGVTKSVRAANGYALRVPFYNAVTDITYLVADISTSTGSINDTKGNSKLYPVPVQSNRVNLILDKEYNNDNYSLSVTNLTGVTHQISNFSNIGESISIDLPSNVFGSGIYFLNIDVDGERRETLKFVIK